MARSKTDADTVSSVGRGLHFGLEWRGVIEYDMACWLMNEQQFESYCWLLEIATIQQRVTLSDSAHNPQQTVLSDSGASEWWTWRCGAWPHDPW
jgi:hypothetical protein